MRSRPICRGQARDRASAGLLTDTASYFGALMTYRGGDAVPIVEQLCQASRTAALQEQAAEAEVVLAKA